MINRNVVNLFILLAIAHIASGCSVLQTLLPSMKPDLHFERIEFIGIDEERLDLRAIILIENRYPISIPASKLNAKVDINNAEFISWKIPVSKIEAASSQPLNLDFSIPYAKLSGMLPDIGNAEVIPLRFSGDVALDLSKVAPNMKDSDMLRLKFDKELKLPVIYPEVNIQNFAIRLSGGDNLSSIADLILSGIDDKELEIGYDLVISNKAAADFRADELNYGFTLNGQRIIIGEALSVENFGKSSILHVKTSLPLSSFSRNFLRFLTTRSADFEAEGGIMFAFPKYEDIPPIKYEFSREGAVRW